MAKAVELLKSVGSSAESVVAKRADGTWFKRYKSHDPRWGWRWTRWVPCGEPTRWTPDNWDGFGYLLAGLDPATVRLPNR